MSVMMVKEFYRSGDGKLFFEYFSNTCSPFPVHWSADRVIGLPKKYIVNYEFKEIKSMSVVKVYPSFEVETKDGPVKLIFQKVFIWDLSIVARLENI